MPKISAPVMSTSSSGTGTLGFTGTGRQSGFRVGTWYIYFGKRIAGLISKRMESWASLVDKSALEGLPDRERRRQEVCLRFSIIRKYKT
jgi:hypothetical protein